MDYATCCTAQICSIVGRCHSHFLNRLDCRLHHNGADKSLIIVHAINQKVVCPSELAIYLYLRGQALVIAAVLRISTGITDRTVRRTPPLVAQASQNYAHSREPPPPM
jgi:hypothetical protein